LKKFLALCVQAKRLLFASILIALRSIIHKTKNICLAGIILFILVRVTIDVDPNMILEDQNHSLPGKIDGLIKGLSGLTTNKSG